MNVSGIIMGTGAPNQCADGRKTKCAIVLAQNLGLIRVYPIPAEKPFPVWGLVDCEIERNEKDSRRESYKIAPDFKIESKIDSPVAKRQLLNECILKSGEHDPLHYQNASRSSIAIVKQDYGSIMACMSQRTPEVLPDDPEFGWVSVQSTFPCKPYIDWQSVQGCEHKSHLLGAEVYEGLRKNHDNPSRIYDIMQLMNPNFDHWLLMGNMRNRRNVWVVVHLHRLKRQADEITQPLFCLDNKPDGWPYAMQETTNEPAPNDQLELFAA